MSRLFKNNKSALLVLLFILEAALSVTAQDKSLTSTWDGIYSEPQAATGAAAYKQNCASCHGDGLLGKGQTPPLIGNDFVANWDGMTLGLLFEKMQSSMPADKPGQLSMSQNAAILAFMLKSNKFPAGGKELPGDPDALKAIRFDAKQPAK